MTTAEFWKNMVGSVITRAGLPTEEQLEESEKASGAVNKYDIAFIEFRRPDGTRIRVTQMGASTSMDDESEARIRMSS